MQQRSKYQQKIIKNYYQNIDAISLQKLGELAGELYLATGKKRAGVWERIVKAMQHLKIPQSRIDHLVKQDQPELVAKLITELMGKE